MLLFSLNSLLCRDPVSRLYIVGVDRMTKKLIDILPIITVAVILLGTIAWLSDIKGKGPLHKFKLYCVIRLFRKELDIKNRVEQVQQELTTKLPDKE